MILWSVFNSGIRGAIRVPGVPDALTIRRKRFGHRHIHQSHVKMHTAPSTSKEVSETSREAGSRLPLHPQQETPVLP